MREYSLYIGTEIGGDGQPIPQFFATVQTLREMATERFGGVSLLHVEGSDKTPDGKPEYEQAIVLKIVTADHAGILNFAQLARVALDQREILVESFEVTTEEVC